MADLKKDERKDKESKGAGAPIPSAAGQGGARAFGSGGAASAPGSVATGASSGVAQVGASGQGFLTGLLSRSAVGRAILGRTAGIAAGGGVGGAIFRSPLAMGLLAGGTLVGAGWGIALLNGTAGGPKPGSDVAVAWDAPGKIGKPGNTRPDSAEQFMDANEGAFGGEPVAEEPTDAVAPTVESEIYEPADASALEADGEPGDPRQAMLAKLLGGKEGKDGEKGGSGLSGLGGINGQTSASLAGGLPAGAKRGSGSAAAGGGGSGKPRELRQVQTSRLGRRGAGKRGTGTSALGQLNTAERLSQAASGTTGETASDTAGAAFDTGAAAEPIGGSGVGESGGLSSGGGSANPPANSGSAITPAEVAEPATPEGGEDPPETGGGGNVTPWQDMVDIATMLLYAAAAILALAYAIQWIWGVGTAIAHTLGLIAAALGAIVAILGVAIIATQPDKTPGLIFTVTGAIIAALGLAIENPEAATAAPVAEAEATAIGSAVPEGASAVTTGEMTAVEAAATEATGSTTIAAETTAQSTAAAEAAKINAIPKP
jgi:hypothetical protein